jgi:large subunit ribosomal protein L22
MEARAVKRYVPTSPRKMRLVADLVRGKSVNEALNILHFSPKHASKVIEMTLRSAISNLSNKVETGKVDETSVIVKTIFVDGGPVMKRVLPAPQGRAFRVRKRSNHLTIVVSEKEEKQSK